MSHTFSFKTIMSSLISGKEFKNRNVLINREFWKCVPLSTYSTFKGSDWNYRITATRPILIKAKNDRMRKAVAIDLSVNLPFAIQISEGVPVEAVEVEKRFSATLKVYTSKNAEGAESEYVEFFEVLDVDQRFEDFVKAYWMYPNYITFELSRIEPL
jgi:hypothetical protein